MRHLTLLLLSVTLATATGCRKAPETPAVVPLTDAELQEASTELQRFFTLAAEESCEALIPFTDGMDSTEQCHEFLHEFNGRRMTIVEIESIQADGRAPDVAICDVRVTEGRNERNRLFRLQRRDDGWHVILAE